MLSEKDEDLLGALRDRIRVKVSITDKYRSMTNRPNREVKVALVFIDDEGESHEISSDSDDIPPEDN